MRGCLKTGLILLVFAFFSFGAGAQLTTVSLTPASDAAIDHEFSGTNFGSDTILKVHTHYDTGDSTYTYSRSLLRFDFTGIPTNAQVYSAKLRLYRDTAFSGSNSYKTALVKTTWAEDSVTSDNWPVTSPFSGDIISTFADSTTFIEIEVKNLAQRLIYGQIPNYGLGVYLSDETFAGTTGSNFYSREAADSMRRPRLVIQYGTSLSLSSIGVTHESGASASDGAIRISVSGGTSPYTYQWFSGQTDAVIGGATADSLVGLGYGWYGLHVTDSRGFQLYKAFAVGQENAAVDITFDPDTYYSSNAYVDSRKDNASLNYRDQNFGNYMGLVSFCNYGTSHWSSYIDFPLWLDTNFTITSAELFLDGWSHYSYPTLGYLNDSRFVLATEHWDENYVTYDFGPSLDTNYTLYIGNLPPGNDNVTVDVSEFWNIWKADNSANHGLYFEILNKTGYYMMQAYFAPGYNGDHIYHPRTYLTLDLRKAIPALNSGIETGNISVDIRDIAGKTPPYMYLVSTDSIPEIHDLYTYVRDSVFGGTLDSSAFYALSTSDEQYQTNDLEYGNYYVSVFDSSGTRIMNSRVLIQKEIGFIDQVGLSVNGPMIIPGQNDALGELDLHTFEGLNSSIEFQLSSTTREQFFGFVSIDSTLADSTDIAYGFVLNGSGLYIVENGVHTLTGYDLSTDSVLRILTLDTSIYLMVRDSILDVKGLPAEFEYRIGLLLQDDSPVTVYYSGFRGPEKKYRIRGGVYQHFDCDGQTGYLKFSVGKLGISGALPITYSISNEDNVYIVEDQSGYTNTDITIDTYGGNPLPPGIYTLTLEINSVPQPPQVFYLGYEVTWSQSDPDYLKLPTLNSLTVQGSNGVNYLDGRSRNIMAAGASGWSITHPKTPNSFTSNFYRYTATSLTTLPGMSMLNEEHIVLIRGSQWGQLWMMCISPGQGIVNFSPVPWNAEFRLMHDNTPTMTAPNGTTSVYVNDILKATLTREDRKIFARCNSLKNNDGFQNVITSFGCHSSDNQYANLEYELDGYYHVMKNGRIKFIYDQEYDTDDLTFRIYDVDDQVVKTDASFAAISTTHGDNFLTIDVSGDEDCIGRGFFYLEVINSKKEKLYLRFFNDFYNPNCDNYIDPNNPSE